MLVDRSIEAVTYFWGRWGPIDETILGCSHLLVQKPLASRCTRLRELIDVLYVLIDLHLMLVLEFEDIALFCESTDTEGRLFLG